jgi:hypothetical protein
MRPPPLVLICTRGCTVEGRWHEPGDVIESHHIEEARHLVRSGRGYPANLSTLERLGDCRRPKERLTESGPVHGPAAARGAAG